MSNVITELANFLGMKSEELLAKIEKIKLDIKSKK